MRDSRSGFTMTEMLIVVFIIGILAAIGIPNMLRSGRRAKVAGATGDVALLKTAIDSYWIHHNYTYPSNIAGDLTGATPRILDRTLVDPCTGRAYNYALTDSNRVYAVWSNGPDGSQGWAWGGSAGASRTIRLNGRDDIVAGNVPVQ